MPQITPQTSTRNVYGLLLAAWTAIVVGFWSVMHFGDGLMVWIMTHYFGLAPADTVTVTEMFQNVPLIAILMIWAMGAGGLYILRRWMSAVNKGPGQKFDVDFQNEHRNVKV